jgi:hypothetical protein
VLSVPFTASDQGGSGVASVTAIFTNPRASDHIQTWILPRWSDNGVSASSVSSTLTVELGPWVASGTWTLARVDIADEQNNQRSYSPSGITTIPDDGTSPPNDIDWTQSMTVDNPNEDVTKPHLTSLHVFEPAIAAGEPMVALYTATDENSGVDGVWFEYTSPRGTSLEAYNNNPVTAGVGPAVWLAPLSAYGGDYTLNDIYVQDRAGNVRRYGLNGDADSVNDVDLRDGDFSVIPVAEDATMPTLDSFTLRSSTSLHPGDQVALDYTAHDDATNVVHVEAWWVDSEDHQSTEGVHCDIGAGSGTITMTLPSFAAAGTWQLLHIEVVDGQNNIADYQRDGSIVKQPTDATGPDQHSFDLSTGDFTVSPGTPTGQTVPSSGGCSSSPDLTLGSTTPDAVAGSDVTLSGAVRHADMPVGAPVLATYSKDSRGVHLLGVTRGSDDGTFAQTVHPRETMHYWASFFGKARGNISDPAESAQGSIRVVQPATVGVARAGDGQLLREAAGAHVRQLGGSTRSAPAVVGHGTDNYYFEITDRAVRVRDDARGWHRFGRPVNGCTGLGATIVRATVRVACVGGDHRVRLASVALGAALPATPRWHLIGSGATASPSLWATSDGVVHVLVRASGGALRTWTSAAGWHALPMGCASSPAANATGRTTFVACTRSDGAVRVWTRAGGIWSSRLVDARAAGAPALSSRRGVVQLWVTTRAHRLATLALDTSNARWTRWSDAVATGVAAGAGVV